MVMGQFPATAAISEAEQGDEDPRNLHERRRRCRLAEPRDLDSRHGEERLVTLPNGNKKRVFIKGDIFK